MTEEGRFQRKIIKFFEQQDIYCIKYQASGMTKSGVCDLLICLDGLFFGIEVKKQDGVVSALQNNNKRNILKNKGVAIILKPDRFCLLKDVILNHRYDTDIKEQLIKVGCQW